MVPRIWCAALLSGNLTLGHLLGYLRSRILSADPKRRSRRGECGWRSPEHKVTGPSDEHSYRGAVPHVSSYMVNPGSPALALAYKQSYSAVQLIYNGDGYHVPSTYQILPIWVRPLVRRVVDRQSLTGSAPAPRRRRRDSRQCRIATIALFCLLWARVAWG